MRIVVAGIAKTGTTGLFYKIKNSLSGVVSSHFECHEAPKVHQSEFDHMLVKVICRENIGFLKTFTDYEKKIAIVRDPRDTIVSSVLYSSGYHCPYVRDVHKVEQMVDLLRRKESGEKISFLSIINKHRELSNQASVELSSYASGCARQNLSMADNLKDFYFFSYDDLVNQNFKTLDSYLEMPLLGSSEVPQCQRRVVRTRESGSWKIWFTPEDVSALRPSLDPVISFFGWDSSWELANTHSIPAEHSSEYYLGLIGECRASAEESDRLKADPNFENEKAKILERLMGPGWKKR